MYPKKVKKHMRLHVDVTNVIKLKNVIPRKIVISAERIINTRNVQKAQVNVGLKNVVPMKKNVLLSKSDHVNNIVETN
jgi:hypothetical protein